MPDTTNPLPAAAAPAIGEPADQTQEAAMALALVRWINGYVPTQPIAHVEILGALLSVYRAVALTWPCCLEGTATQTRRVADELDRVRLGLLRAAGAVDGTNTRH